MLVLCRDAYREVIGSMSRKRNSKTTICFIIFETPTIFIHAFYHMWLPQIVLQHLDVSTCYDTFSMRMCLWKLIWQCTKSSNMARVKLFYGIPKCSPSPPYTIISFAYMIHWNYSSRNHTFANTFGHWRPEEDNRMRRRITHFNVASLHAISKCSKPSCHY